MRHDAAEARRVADVDCRHWPWRLGLGGGGLLGRAGSGGRADADELRLTIRGGESSRRLVAHRACRARMAWCRRARQRARGRAPPFSDGLRARSDGSHSCTRRVESGIVELEQAVAASDGRVARRTKHKHPRRANAVAPGFMVAGWLLTAAISATALSTFSDDDGYFFYTLASASYCTNKTLAAWDCMPCKAAGGATLLPSTLTVFFNSSTDARALTAVVGDRNTNAKYIVLSWRGTETLHNWLEDAHFFKTDRGMSCDGCKVHSGFVDVWASLAPKIVPELERLRVHHPVIAARRRRPLARRRRRLRRRVHFSQRFGHRRERRFYTYGGPRVGNKQFADRPSPRAPLGGSPTTATSCRTCRRRRYSASSTRRARRSTSTKPFVPSLRRHRRGQPVLARLHDRLGVGPSELLRRDDRRGWLRAVHTAERESGGAAS